MPEWLIEKPYLKPYLPLPTSAQVVAGRPYHVRRDNTVSYRCFSLYHWGRIKGPNTTVQLEVDDRQLLLSDASGSLLARHELSYRKGVTQVNNHHRRDISQSVMQLQEALIGKFSDQAQARLFINSIFTSVILAIVVISTSTCCTPAAVNLKACETGRSAIVSVITCFFLQ